MSMSLPLDVISMLESSSAWAPVLAACAGIATSLSPCCLGNISVSIALINGIEEPTPARAFLLSLLYALGDSLVFAGLGVISALVGSVVSVPRSLLYVLSGLVMLLMALQVWGLFELVPTSRLLERKVFQGGWGAFVTGLITGLFASPCCVPVMVAMIAASISSGSIFWGLASMLSYAVAHNVMVVVAGTSFGFAQGLLHSTRARRLSLFLHKTMGLFMVFIAGCLFYLLASAA